MQRFIWVTHNFKGTHNWPEASSFAGEQVDFLEARHRHTFHLKVTIEVSHSNRDVEFFVLQKEVSDAVDELYSSMWDGMVYNLGRRSCETIAEEILGKLHKYQGFVEVAVSEDNEVGAVVSRK